MDDIINPKELRKEAHFRRLKSRNPICLRCGYNTCPAALEYAHVIPRKFGVGDGGALCRNCHREITEAEVGLGFTPQAEDRELEQAGRYVLALGEWLEIIARTLKHFGASLLQRVETIPAQSEGEQ
ncbi:MULTISPECIES: HNH endonuclease signature motif containing protein [unclassified Hyphomonas]|uniref:HNH endonuclease signature motif containing protein n=1 Tax=unclassified Hyphomonas TaxID=2630699 RepID=UPI00111243F7|nr:MULTISPECIES: HNH endonuclease signature motif containing protein [unclassified Hyphomonas]